MDDRSQANDPSGAIPADVQADSTETAASTDGPPDEIEPGTAVKEELDCFAHHPRAEASRLHRLEEEGESGATPYLYVLRAARIILPAAAVLLAIALLTYYLS